MLRQSVLRCEHFEPKPASGKIFVAGSDTLHPLSVSLEPDSESLVMPGVCSVKVLGLCEASQALTSFLELIPWTRWDRLPSSQGDGLRRILSLDDLPGIFKEVYVDRSGGRTELLRRVIAAYKQAAAMVCQFSGTGAYSLPAILATAEGARPQDARITRT